MLEFLQSTLRFTGTLFLVLLVFNFVILVHEWGHFLAARWRGLKVEKFQIWMGKPVWKKTWNGVQYGLGWLPIGGFVSLPQMAPMEAIEGPSPDGEPRESLPPIKPLDKIIVAFAGPLFSLLLAFACACLVWKVGRPVSAAEATTVIGLVAPDMPGAKAGLKPGDEILEIAGRPVKKFVGLNDSVVWAIASSTTDDIPFKVRRPGEPEPRMIPVHAPVQDNPEYKQYRENLSWFGKIFARPPLRKVGIGPAVDYQIEEIYPNSPAARAGLQKGDRIVEVNGEKVYNASIVEDVAEKKPGEPMRLKALRGDQTLEVTLTPRKPDEPDDAKRAMTGVKTLGLVKSEAVKDIYPTPVESMKGFIMNTFATLRALVSPGSSIGAGHMSGPVGIMNLYYNIFQHPEAWKLVLWFSVMLNVGLAIFNLLPFPVLDGGHITMALMEAIRRRPLDLRVLEYVQSICVLALLCFGLFVTLKDVGTVAEREEKPREIKFHDPAAGSPPPALSSSSAN